MLSSIQASSPLLNNRFWLAEKFFAYKRKYGIYLQIFMTLAFAFLIIAPLNSSVPKSEDTIFSSITLFSQFLFWGIWYWACLLSVIPFGRLWCGVLCPLGAISEFVGIFGLKKDLPKWVTWEGWLVIMFIVITILGQTLDVRDDPYGMLKLFSMIFSLAIIIGFLYGKNKGRPWCRYFCPIGKILGVVNRLSIIDFSPNSGAKTLQKNKKFYTHGKLCPTDYKLPYKVSNNNCIACGRCTFKAQYLKNKQKKSGVGVYLRKPGAELEQVMNKNPSFYEILFILISPGLSAGGFLWLILNQYNNFRDSIGAWALNNNFMWVFNSAFSLISSHNWNQNFNWLDVFSITIYMLIYAFVIGGFVSIFISIAVLLLKSKSSVFKNDFFYLTYQLTPVSILSIVIGLSGKFFNTLEISFGMPSTVSLVVKSILFFGSVFWSFVFFSKAINKFKQKSKWRYFFAWFCIVVVVAILTSIWLPAIFNYTYMSEVEQIRKHIVLP